MKELAKRSSLPVKAIAKPVAFVPSPIREDRLWTCQGVVCRHTGEAKAYLRQEALAHFLNHVQEGTVFNYKMIPYATNFGSGDFYTIISWMMDHDLVVKEGSRYAIPSKKAIIETWNKYVETMRL